MVQQINVPTIGIVNFPDNMSDDEISDAIKKNLSSNQQNINNVNTLFGQLPHRNFKDIEKSMMPTQEDLEKSAGIATMLMGPEFKVGEAFGRFVPKMIKNIIPKTEGNLKLLSDSLGNIAKTGISSYAGSKMMPGSDEVNAEKSGLMGAGIATALTPFSIAAGSMNPYVRMIAGGTLGTMGGYGLNKLFGVNSYPGLILPTILGALGGHSALGNRGINQLAIENAAGKATPEQIANAINMKKSAQDVGIDINMLEALNTPWAHEQLKDLGQTQQSANIMAQRGINRLPKERSAIQDLLERISPKNAKEEFESPLYKQATSSEVPGLELAKIYQDPYLKNKIDQVLSDPINSDIFQGVSPTSLKVLDLVKRKIDAERFSPSIDKYEAERLKEKSDKIVNLADSASPKLQDDLSLNNSIYKKGTPLYQVARDVSEKRITRDKILNSMNEAEINGSNFYDTWLRDDDKFKQLRYNLRDRNNPDITTPAQKKLDSMREIFPSMINPMNRQVVNKISETNLELPTSVRSVMGKMFNNLFLNKYNNALTDLIWKSDWDNDLKNISNIKSKEDKGIALGRLLSRISSTGLNIFGQSNQQGSNEYGAQS